MVQFPEGLIENALDAKATHLGRADLDRIAQSREAVLLAIDQFPERWSKAKRQALLLFDLVAAGRAPDEARIQAAAALIYLAAPVDLVPDDEADGFADDAAIVGLAVARIEEHVRAHCQAGGLDVTAYV